MQTSLGFVLALATLSAAAAHAQYADPASQGYPVNSSSAPIVQAYPNGSGPYGARSTSPSRQFFDLQPAAGVTVRGDASGGVQTVNASSGVTELRVAQGRADITVHHPADHSEILVDLPGGQVALLKDGLYTFNAATDTVRVLHGEAEAYSGTRTPEKGAKVKEGQQLALYSNVKLKAVDAYPYELTADLLGGGPMHDDGITYPGGGYGDGFYGGGYPYYAGFYGAPFGYGYYPYGFGYPVGLGIGFGYYGGFRGGFGGYRGGFRR